MPKKKGEEKLSLDEDCIISAFEVYNAEYYPIDPVEIQRSDIDELRLILYSQCPSPDKLVIKKQLFEKLSIDARQIIFICINPEVIDHEICSQDYLIINLKRIRRYLRRKKGWDIDRLYKAIKEIKNFLRNI